jgi:hypothetical protein
MGTTHRGLPLTVRFIQATRCAWLSQMLIIGYSIASGGSASAGCLGPGFRLPADDRSPVRPE